MWPTIRFPWRPFFSFLAGCILLPGLLGAEDVNRPSLTLQQAIADALVHNPDLQASEISAQIARLAMKDSHLQRYPKVSLAGQYTASDDIHKQLPDADAAVVRADEYLFQGGRLAADIQRLGALQKSAVAQVDVKRLALVLGVQECFYRALADQEQWDIWGQAQKEYTYLLKLTEPSFTLGSVPEYDFVKIKLSLVQYERGRLDSQRAFDHERFVLGALMGADPPTTLAALPALNAPTPVTSETLMDKIGLRPDVQAADSQLAAQNFALTRARRERWPDLRLSGDYGYSGQYARDVTIGWGFFTAATLPIFDFGTIRTNIAMAQSERQALEYQKESLRLQIRTELNDALQAAQTAWENLVTAQQSIPQAQKAYESSLRCYRTGLAAMTELSDAHDLWIQSRLRLAQATADYRSAEAQLQASQGVLQP